MNLISIEVTSDIAEKIRFMAESGLFALPTGNATLNFHNGVLKSIKTEVFSYPKSSPQPTSSSILNGVVG